MTKSSGVFAMPRRRDEIIGDIIATLRAERFDLAEYSRWATWERDVLSRLPEPGEAQRVIAERQAEANCEQDEAEIVEELFASRLAWLDYNPQTDQARIPVGIAAKWLAEAVGDKVKTAAASKRIRQMANEGQLTRIEPDPSRTYGRGFVWTGVNADIYGSYIANDLPGRLAETVERT